MTLASEEKIGPDDHGLLHVTDDPDDVIRAIQRVDQGV